MKKCVVMFCLLISMLIFAVLSDKKEKFDVDDELVISEVESENIAFGKSKSDKLNIGD